MGFMSHIANSKIGKAGAAAMGLGSIAMSPELLSGIPSVSQAYAAEQKPPKQDKELTELELLEQYRDKGLYICGKGEVIFMYRTTPSGEWVLNTTVFYPIQGGKSRQLDVVHSVDAKNPTFKLKGSDTVNGDLVSRVKKEDADFLSVAYRKLAINPLAENLAYGQCRRVDLPSSRR